MALSYSLSHFVNYMNDQTSKKETELSQAFRKDVKAAIALAGYPTKDEIDIIDTVEGLKMTNTATVMNKSIAEYIKATDRAFEIPPVDEETCRCVIGRVDKPEDIKEGTGPNGAWKNLVKAHTEYFAKNKRKPFVTPMDV